jgi:GTP cyclohydrolase I
MSDQSRPGSARRVARQASPDDEGHGVETMNRKRMIKWQEILDMLAPIDLPGERVYGIPRGGMICSAFLKKAEVVYEPTCATLLLDDICDSGATRERYINKYPGRRFYALFNRKEDRLGTDWLVFPWEEEHQPEDAVVRLLQFIGEDPTREGLIDTPERVVKSFAEMTEGYRMSAADILSKDFTQNYDEMISLKNIRFTSLCEHHLLPFIGTAAIAYVPTGKVVGISKLARLVEMFAKRLQIQEQMTQQIADALMEHIKPKGAGVIIRAHHHCMGCRGVRQPDAEMVTTCLRGVMMNDTSARSEFLTSC